MTWTADDLYKLHWMSDPDCEKWWRDWNDPPTPDEIYTFEEAVRIQEEW